MTCYVCNYEFCWACGAYAANYAHFKDGTGCGVPLMDATVKPGDHLARGLDKPGLNWAKIKQFFKQAL